MRRKQVFLLTLVLGVFVLLLFMQTVRENDDVFNPKAMLEHTPRAHVTHSLRIIPSSIIPKKFIDSKKSALDSQEMTPSRTDVASFRKPQQTSLRKLADKPKLKTTTVSVINHFQDVRWADLHEEQERRKSFLQNFCEKFRRSGAPRLDLSGMVSRLYVEEKHKVLYCEVPKAGCSNWKRTLMVLNGLARSTDEISHEAVHYGKRLKTLASFDRASIQGRLRSFTKVVAVRDPVERLVSAFRDKFEQPNSYYHPVFGRAIIRKYRENATQEALQSGSGVTFLEFVRYLLDPDRPVGMDIHWEPVSRLCFPCFITYDFISKFETLEQDANYFLRKIGAAENLTFPYFKDRHSAEARTTPTVVSQYINQVPPADRRRLYDFFYLDYLMFNYSMPLSL